jgi:hypothetical protein
MTDATGITRRLQRDGYAVIPGLLSQSALAAARAELGALLEVAQWGPGFDDTRTKRAWAPLAVTRCLHAVRPHLRHPGASRPVVDLVDSQPARNQRRNKFCARETTQSFEVLTDHNRRFE